MNHSQPVMSQSSAVVSLNCVTNRVAQKPDHKLSYDAKQYNDIHTLLDVSYLQPPHPTVRQVIIQISCNSGYAELLEVL
jgi:hypothetical protein